MSMAQYDQWKTTNPMEMFAFVCKCEQCRTELYQGDEVIMDMDEQIFCGESCLEEYQYANGLVQKISL